MSSNDFLHTMQSRIADEAKQRAGKEDDEVVEPAVSIIIPVFNKVEFTRQCLDALYANTKTDVPFEVIIVDNASTDDTPRYLQSAQAQYPNLRVVTNAENTGFAHACNQGAQAAVGKYVLFLNNDTEVQPDWLTAMLKPFTDYADAGVVGNKLLFPDGTIRHAGVAIVRDMKKDIPVSAWHIGYRHQDSPAFNRVLPLQAVTAACMLVKKRVFEEVGGFDEAYWNGYEDVDFCLKVG